MRGVTRTSNIINSTRRRWFGSRHRCSIWHQQFGLRIDKASLLHFWLLDNWKFPSLRNILWLDSFDRRLFLLCHCYILAFILSSVVLGRKLDSTKQGILLHFLRLLLILLWLARNWNSLRLIIFSHLRIFFVRITQIHFLLLTHLLTKSA